MAIRVMISDDQEMVREGLAAMLSSEPDIEVVGEAMNGIEAVQRAVELDPDVILMDIRMPELGGIDATRILIEDRGMHVKIVILTTFDLDQYVYTALRNGASGFLLKDATGDQIAEAVRTVAAGDAMIAPSITKRLISEFVKSGAPGASDAVSREKLDILTGRETEVLKLIAQGLSNAEIAACLVVAEETVKSHVGRILEKLHLRDRTQATVFAYESGLVGRKAG